MVELKEVWLVFRLLRHKSWWYIDPEGAECFANIVEKAKSHADKRLTKMNFITFLLRYWKWRRKDRIISPRETHYEAFLNDLVFELGLSALELSERDYYCESCNLTLRFI